MPLLEQLQVLGEVGLVLLELARGRHLQLREVGGVEQVLQNMLICILALLIINIVVGVRMGTRGTLLCLLLHFGEVVAQVGHPTENGPGHHLELVEHKHLQRGEWRFRQNYK